MAAKQHFAAKALNPETEALKEKCRHTVDALEVFIGECKKKCEFFSANFGTNSGRLGELMRSGDSDKYAQSLLDEAKKEASVMNTEVTAKYSELIAEFDKACGALVSRVQDSSPSSGMSAYMNANWIQALDTCATVILQGFSDVAEGVSFFNRLGEYLQRLKVQVEDYCFARAEEKNSILQNIQRSLGSAALNHGDVSPVTVGQYSFEDDQPSAPPQINFGNPNKL